MFGTFSGMNNPNDSSVEVIDKPAPVEETGESESNVESETTEKVETESQEETTAEEQGSDDESQEDKDTDTETVKKPKKGFERRIERFNQKLSQKDQEIEYWKKAAMGGAQSVVQPEQTAPAQTGKPQFADYNDIESYTEALTDWKVSQALESVNQKQQVKSVVDTYTQRLNEFKKATPDFQDTLDEFVEEYGDKPIPEVVQVAMESEVGPQIAYYLAKNTAEVDRIALLPPHRRLLELGKLEERLSKGITKVEPETKKISKAPAPIEGVKGTGKVSSKDIYDDDIPYAEWVKLRTKKK